MLVLTAELGQGGSHTPEEAAAESDRQLRDVRNELGCSEAALSVAREAHATVAQQYTAAKDEAAAMREELQAATEELGGGTVEMCKSALKDYARKLAVAEEEAYAVDAAHAVSMRLLATELGAAEHSFSIAEDVVESVREDAACVVEEAAARVEAAEEEAAALADEAAAARAETAQAVAAAEAATLELEAARAEIERAWSEASRVSDAAAEEEARAARAAAAMVMAHGSGAAMAEVDEETPQTLVWWMAMANAA